MRRVVITGMGVVSPIGSTLESFWSNAKAGKSGTGLITYFDTTDYAVKIAGELEGFNPEDYISKKDLRRTDMFCVYALAAAKMAMDDSGINMESEDPNMCGAVIGSGIGGLQTLQTQHANVRDKGPSRCSPFLIPQMIVNMASGLVAIEHNLRAPNYSVVSACASAAHSIGEAKNIIARGEADVMLSGGAEAAICELGIAGFASMKALSTRNDEPSAASRPFDQTRDGFVMGEGAAVVVLEEYERAKARGADIYCEMAGFGMSCDANHITAPASDGEGATRAMKMALADGGINPDEVSYINAHGTSTPLNDKIESLAIKNAIGEENAAKVMISSSKSMTGHLLGAAAGVESVICAMAIKEGVVSPTINYKTPDPECDLDYVPNESREAEVNITLNNSLGFGGHNACLAFRKI